MCKPDVLCFHQSKMCFFVPGKDLCAQSDEREHQPQALKGITVHQAWLKTIKAREKMSMCYDLIHDC